jgi:hypothetical protein
LSFNMSWNDSAKVLAAKLAMSNRQSLIPYDVRGEQTLHMRDQCYGSLAKARWTKHAIGELRQEKGDRTEPSAARRASILDPSGRVRYF